ncbi:hypothetical protein BDV36DRAFT_220486 [Aspergillus pseudocaelatus]|uniref:Restriction endonuclease domain-containing protein n=1 Tax=Aspergillus pseudocaelatus TaxID=1825620 RepID=A0ABQ6WJG3_9EURO|nr:hypothetical protein BDV36DRAFT_220486 [Aspergillus pseudocaelatus]
MLTSSELALTEVYPPTTYTDIRAMKKAVADTRNRLVTEDINQYLSFKHVSPKDFSFIDAHRRQLGAVRFTYFQDISTLIIKVPTRAHEIAHRNFERMISSQFGAMNIGIDQFLSLGSTLYVGPTASKKEGDSAFTNSVLRPLESDWPALVIEAGVSESMPRLRQDAQWWISNSEGKVHIVLLIKVTRNARSMVFEKYVPEVLMFRQPRISAPHSYRAVLVSTTEVHQGANPPYVSGPPVILEFQRVLCRPPVPPERDIQLGPAELLLLARLVFPH